MPFDIQKLKSAPVSGFVMQWSTIRVLLNPPGPDITKIGSTFGRGPGTRLHHRDAQGRYIVSDEKMAAVKAERKARAIAPPSPMKLKLRAMLLEKQKAQAAMAIRRMGGKPK